MSMIGTRMLLKELLNEIEYLLPKNSALDGDRVGLQIESSAEANRILVAMEIDDSVIKEAIDSKIDCIIVFHPLIYNPIKEIINTDRTGKLVSECIRNNISLIAVHTCFDVFENGTSKIYSDLLELEFEKVLVLNTNSDSVGMGVISHSKNPISILDLINRIHKLSNSPVRYSNFKDINKKINKIAIVGGSGSSYIQESINNSADVLITADCTYHRFHDVSGKLILIDPGHYEMEKYVAKNLTEILIEILKNKNLEYEFIRTSQINTNPISYYSENN